MAGYLPVEANADAFAEGWYRTCDVGWIEPQDAVHLIRLRDDELYRHPSHRICLWPPQPVGWYCSGRFGGRVKTMGLGGGSGLPATVGRLLSWAPGLVLAVVVALGATMLGKLAPVVGSPVIGIVLGVLLSAWVRQQSRWQPGVAFAGRTVLQLAVVVLGAQLSLRQVADVGVGSLPVMLATVAVCLAVAYVVGRRLGIEPDLRTLIGVGTAICGASAIAAVSPVIRAKHAAVAYAISTIFLFNVAAVLVFPPLGHLLGLSQHSFGLFAGTAVNDTSSVVAASASYGEAASHYAVVVKLTRTLMIIPICLALAAVVRRRDQAAQAAEGESLVRVEEHALVRAARLVPWFLIGFLLVAAANSAGAIPASSHSALQTSALFLITVALAAIGMSTDLAALRRAGSRPLLLGFILWVAVAATSLLMQQARI